MLEGREAGKQWEFSADAEDVWPGPGSEQGGHVSVPPDTAVWQTHRPALAALPWMAQDSLSDSLHHHAPSPTGLRERPGLPRARLLASACPG